MKTKSEIAAWARGIDLQYSDLKTKYGAFKNNNKWYVNLWQPLAKEVSIIVFDKHNQNKIVKKVKGKFIAPNWQWIFEDDMDGYYYQYEIKHDENNTTIALDPFAKSMASFNWGGKTDKIGKAAFVDVEKIKLHNKLSKIYKPQPIIYEASIRDLTSLRKDVKQPGSFNAVQEAKIAEHIKDLGFTTIQFLPVTSCYALDENNKSIIKKGKGKDWKTNYNWGYDPHNYFSINGWYSSNANDPYARISEFKSLVKYFHNNNINVVIDVVYNHLMTNNILNNIFPEYYFRNGSDKKNIVTPVADPPLASERVMCRRIIIDSLKWLVDVYDVDGFRFDLSCFTDKETIKKIYKTLKKIKPNLILHGEAWQWSDIEFTNTLIKGVTDNNYDFAYFNDSTRNAIRGEDDGDGFESGILGSNVDKEFGNYLPAIIGNIEKFKNEPKEMSKKRYERFTKYPNNNLQYSSCHDGHTLWDKVNLTTVGDRTYKMEKLRQSMMMLLLTQGRIMFLAGAEMLYTKPYDPSGKDRERYHESEDILDIFNFGKKYHGNTYKNTDWSAGMRWDNLDQRIHNDIYKFFKKLNHFRKKTAFFNLNSTSKINKYIHFNYVNKKMGIIDFSIKIKKQSIRVIHNLKNNEYEYSHKNEEIFIDSKLEQAKIGISMPHSSQLIINKGANYD